MKAILFLEKLKVLIDQHGDIEIAYEDTAQYYQAETTKVNYISDVSFTINDKNEPLLFII